MEAISHRNQVQAKGFSCGCVFKNPPNASAGQLIEKCGLKGKTKGGAIISPQHGNFIINQNNAYKINQNQAAKQWGNDYSNIFRLKHATLM